MTHESLAIAPRRQDWIDETFLWTASSLAVMAIAATFTAASNWPASSHRRLALAAQRPPPAVRLRAHPAPAIAFGEPVPGYPVISPFGLRQLPWEEGGRLHKGVDIAAPMGAPVLAAASGVVLRTGVDAGYGRFIELGHAGGMSSLYGHLSAFQARPGMRVRQGQPVGRIGSTGSSTGAHLHFEIHDPEGRPLNPQMLMGRSFLRLADLPMRAAARLPRRVRVAFVSYIPPAKAALMEARREARAEAGQERAAARTAAPDIVAPMQIGVVPAEKVALSRSESVIRIDGRGPDGRVHAVITTGG